MSTPDQLIPRRPNETDAERRFREAINRLGGQLLQTLDASMGLRTAPNEASRARGRARGHLSDFAAQAQIAFGTAQERALPPED